MRHPEDERSACELFASASEFFGALYMLVSYMTLAASPLASKTNDWKPFV